MHRPTKILCKFYWIRESLAHTKLGRQVRLLDLSQKSPLPSLLFSRWHVFYKVSCSFVADFWRLAPAETFVCFCVERLPLAALLAIPSTSSNSLQSWCAYATPCVGVGRGRRPAARLFSFACGSGLCLLMLSVLTPLQPQKESFLRCSGSFQVHKRLQSGMYRPSTLFSIYIYVYAWYDVGGKTVKMMM